MNIVLTIKYVVRITFSGRAHRASLSCCCCCGCMVNRIICWRYRICDFHSVHFFLTLNRKSSCMCISWSPSVTPIDFVLFCLSFHFSTPNLRHDDEYILIYDVERGATAMGFYLIHFHLSKFLLTRHKRAWIYERLRLHERKKQWNMDLLGCSKRWEIFCGWQLANAPGQNWWSFSLVFVLFDSDFDFDFNFNVFFPLRSSYLNCYCRCNVPCANT